MARITVEDCLQKSSNRFELVMLAAVRARQLLKGAKPLIEADNREVVTALREIAAGKVRRATPKAGRGPLSRPNPAGFLFHVSRPLATTFHPHPRRPPTT